MTLGIVVPSQLDIESQHDGDGSCSLILDRLSHISYVLMRQSEEGEKDDD
jgi:hypothetical protein